MDGCWHAAERVAAGFEPSHACSTDRSARRAPDSAVHFGVADNSSLVARIEPLTAGDAVAVAQCIALDTDTFPYASATFGLREAAARAWVARDVRNPEGRFPVIGFIAGHHRRGTLHIGGLAVDPRVRRRGVGRALLLEAVDSARGEGMGALALHVSVANRVAIELYRREGFSVRARLQRFYPSSAYGGERDAYEMQLRL